MQDLPLGGSLCDCALFDKLHLRDTTVGLGLGTRYSSIRQIYQGKLLLSNNDNSTVGAQQDFIGFGLTSAVSVIYPLDRGFSLFSNTRGSVLIGPNHKVSTATANVAGSAAPSISLEETRTDVIPVGELEMGIEWGKMIGQGQPAQGQVKGTLVWVRAAVVGQIWGNVGFLSATNNQPSFKDRPLYLAGFSLMFGLER